GLPTIQGEIERVLGEIEGRRVWVHGSGRTDAGVHAHQQAASVTIENPIPVVNLRRAMNRLLTPAIRVLSVDEVPPGFHARFSAGSKIYEYRLCRGEVCPPEMHRYAYHHPYPLAIEPMAIAATLLEGTHDFQAFASADDESGKEENTERTIFSSRFEAGGDLLRYRVEGSGFLHHMVRNIMGTLLEV